MTTVAHIKVGLANPFLRCEQCTQRVPYWHNPERCGCGDAAFNYPCGCEAETYSLCSTWGPLEGCSCSEQHIK